MEQIIFLRQGNPAWIDSITWYSLSTECEQFNRRSVRFFKFFFYSFFFYSRDNLVTSLRSPQHGRQREQNRWGRKCLCWHCVQGLTPQGEWTPGVGQGGYYANLIAEASGCLRSWIFKSLFVIIIYERCLGWMSKDWKIQTVSESRGKESGGRKNNSCFIYPFPCRDVLFTGSN